MGNYLDALQDLVIFCDLKNLVIKHANSSFWNFFKIAESSFALPSLLGQSFSLKLCTEEIKIRGKHSFGLLYKKNDQMLKVEFDVFVTKLKEEVLICFHGKILYPKEEKLELLSKLKYLLKDFESKEEIKKAIELLESTLLDKPLSSPEELKESTSIIDTLDSKPLKVLIVEDNRVNAVVLERILVKQGFLPITAENGKIGLEKWQEESFDFILMDLQMPVMNGFELTKEIRKIEEEDNIPKIPIIAVSANILEEDKSICLRAGMDDFVQKPIHSKTLLSVIKKVLG